MEVEQRVRRVGRGMGRNDDEESSGGYERPKPLPLLRDKGPTTSASHRGVVERKLEKRRERKERREEESYARHWAKTRGKAAQERKSMRQRWDRPVENDEDDVNHKEKLLLEELDVAEATGGAAPDVAEFEDREDESQGSETVTGSARDGAGSSMSGEDQTGEEVGAGGGGWGGLEGSVGGGKGGMVQFNRAIRQKRRQEELEEAGKALPEEEAMRKKISIKLMRADGLHCSGDYSKSELMSYRDHAEKKLAEIVAKAERRVEKVRERHRREDAKLGGEENEEEKQWWMLRDGEAKVDWRELNEDGDEVGEGEGDEVEDELRSRSSKDRAGKGRDAAGGKSRKGVHRDEESVKMVDDDLFDDSEAVRDVSCFNLSLDIFRLLLPLQQPPPVPSLSLSLSPSPSQLVIVFVSIYLYL